MADIDGDEDIELIVAPEGADPYKINLPYINAWHHDGTVVDGWPIKPMFLGRLSPALGDADGDGDIDIFYVDLDEVYAYDIPGQVKSTTMHWPMYQHDPQHTGCYIPPTEPSLGDLNQDGRINQADIQLIENFLTHRQEPTSIQKDLADLNFNTKVDRHDWLTLQGSVEDRIQQEDLPLMLGDVNGDQIVNIFDITKTEMLLAGQGDFTEAQKLQADTNANNRTDKHDIKLIENVIVQIIQQQDLPIEMGDMDDDDDIDIVDIQRISGYVGSIETPTKKELLYGDLNLNDKFDQGDLDHMNPMFVSQRLKQ